MLKEKNDIPTGSLPIEEFRAHLRLGTGFSDDTVQDTVLSSFLRAAIAAIEARTGKILLERSFSWTRNFWRAPTEEALPVAPITEVIDITLKARDGSVTQVDPSSYVLLEDTQRPIIQSLYGSLPHLTGGTQAVIRFQAGFGPNWQDLPADLAQAVMLLAAHYYEYRHETALADGCMPFGVTSLIERYRIVRLLTRGEQS